MRVDWVKQKRLGVGISVPNLFPFDEPVESNPSGAQLHAKNALWIWGQAYPTFSPIVGYGTATDFTGNWSDRDRQMMTAFSNWWNLTHPSQAIVIVDKPTNDNIKALDAWLKEQVQAQSGIVVPAEFPHSAPEQSPITIPILPLPPAPSPTLPNSPFVPVAPQPVPTPTLPNVPFTPSAPVTPTTTTATTKSSALPIVLGGAALLGLGWLLLSGVMLQANPEAQPTFHVYLERVPLNRGGYDRRGTYWGVGAPLYRYSDESGALDGYVRAHSREEAKEKVRYQSPGMEIKFKRAG